MIDIRKKYRTRDGRTVSNLSLRTDDKSFPITGNIGEYGNQSWDDNGKYYGHGLSTNDLIEITPEVTLESLAAAGFKLLVSSDNTEYRVQIERGDYRAFSRANNIADAARGALDLWEVNSTRDYVAVLYVLPGGIVTTSSPLIGDPTPIARKVVRFTAKSGDVE